MRPYLSALISKLYPLATHVERDFPVKTKKKRAGKNKHIEAGQFDSPTLLASTVTEG